MATPELVALRNDLLLESRGGGKSSGKRPSRDHQSPPGETDHLRQPADPAAVRVAIPKHTIDEGHAMGLGVLAAELDLG